ncbi:MAG: hypothetical protein WC761_01375 [Candidatus Paceibacterota bacterium]|jgi:hypothetical protein
MATFLTTVKPTPFGFFDSDTTYQNDADKIVTFVLRKLGEDVLSVELTKKMIWACFEEATLGFNALMIEYQAKSNLASILGNPTGSIDPVTGKYALNLINNYVQPNFEFLIRQAEPYASEVGYGQSMDSYSGSIDLVLGRQDYDLYTDLKDSNGQALSTYMGTGSFVGTGRMKIFEVYHFAPIQYVFNSNLASNFVASGLPVESYIPDTRFYVLPLFEDVLRASMLETAQKVRRSHYTYRITGRNIRILPAPNNLIPFFNDKLWIRVGFPPSAAPGVITGSQDGISGSASGSFGYPIIGGGIIFGVSNPANIPAGFIQYNSINPWARNWIIQMTLALAKELLGLVRNKFKNFPIPGAELTLNGDDLIAQAREDKVALISGEAGIVKLLESLTYDKLAELEANRAEQIMKLLQYMPMPPKYALFMG